MFYASALLLTKILFAFDVDCFIFSDSKQNWKAKFPLFEYFFSRFKTG